MKMWKEKIQKLLSVFTIAQMLLVFVMPTAAMASTTTLVGWTFPAAPADATADMGIAANLSKAIVPFGLAGVNYTADSRHIDDPADKAARASNWDDGDEYWQVNFATTGYSGLTLGSWQKSSKQGPEDFQVQYKVGASGTWTNLGSSYVLSETWSGITRSLPADCNNNSDVYIRWKVDSDHAVERDKDGDIKDIDANGTSSIDDIMITGGLIDSDPPVISAHGDEYADATSAAGAVVAYALPTATDAVDGTLPVNCVPASGSAFVIGDTTVTCTVTDAANNIATTTFVVHVVDTAPVITLNGTTPFQVEKGTSYNELGADWTDAVDGTGPAVVGGDVVDVNTLGTYTVTYNYTDTAGNPAAQVTRTVIVVDTISPNIQFISPTPVDGTTLTTDHFQVRVETDEDATRCELTINNGSAYEMLGADNNEFYLDIADLDDGDYTYEVSCWDASENHGNSISRDISIDTAGPVVGYIAPTPDDGAVIGGEEFEVRVDAGDAEACYIFVDSEEFSEDMLRDGESNEFWFGFGDVPEGTYEYYVACYDEHENRTEIDPRTITLDQTPPVLTLVGASPISVVIGNTYSDLGATANDNEDGDITANIVKSGDAVNTGVLGSYVIRYNVSDSAGNPAVEVTRTVNVVAAPIVPLATPVVTPVVAAVVTTAPVAAATDAPAVAAAETAAPAAETPAVEDTGVKGSSDKACPWWWIVALILVAALAVLGGVTRTLDESNFVRKYYYIWPPVLALVAWLAHRYLQDGLQATWLCNHYWFVMLTIAVIGEVGLAYFARNRKQQ